MSNQGTTSLPEVAAPRRLGRSIWAIVAGFLVVVALSLLTDTLLEKLGVFPQLGNRLSDNLALLATFYRTLYSILGSYITARLAPNRPMFHAMIGACIGMVLGTIGVFVTWNKDLGPHWYAIALVVEGIPCTWIGARISQMQISGRKN